MSKYIGPSEAKEMAIAAGAKDVLWVASFLVWCGDKADAQRSIDALKSISPDRFFNNPKRPTRRPTGQGAKWDAQKWRKK
jgi:hypothetical protein